MSAMVKFDWRHAMSDFVKAHQVPKGGENNAKEQCKDGSCSCRNDGDATVRSDGR